MKVYLVRDTYHTGEIKEAEGHPLTGHPDDIQVNGIYARRNRVFYKGQWAPTREEAIEIVRKMADQMENSGSYYNRQIVENAQRVDRMRKLVGDNQVHQELNLKFETTFVVMPTHCNYHYPMIFGGAFFGEMDLCAAQCVSRLLHASECDSAVTYKYDGTFYAAAECGDIVFLTAEVVELRHKAIKLSVKAYRERRCKPGRDFVAEASFVFVTKKGDVFTPHGLTMAPKEAT